MDRKPDGAQPRVLIYVPQLLPIYQPWARSHVANLSIFHGALFGRQRLAKGVDLAGLNNWALSDAPLGRLRGGAFLLTGRSRELEARVRAFAPDVIHAHFGVGGTEIAAVADALGVPLVVSYHGWDAWIGQSPAPPRLYERLHLARRARLARSAALVLAPSRFFRDHVIALGFPRERTEVHYMGIDSGFFAEADRAAAQPAGILLVGRLARGKGAAEAVDAVAQVAATHPQAHLTIVGDGPERAALEARVAARSLPVTFLGALGRDEVRACLAAARVHLYPSTTRHGDRPEALGLGPLEAQAAGVPSIATRSGGLPEVVRDGETGFLVPDGDPSALARQIVHLIDDDTLHARLSAQARRFVAEHFDAAANTRTLEQRYLRLLAERR